MKDGKADKYLMSAAAHEQPLLSSAELPENWTDSRETVLEGVTFNLRHLGMTLVDQPKGEELSAAAVKRIVATVRAHRLHHFLPKSTTLTK